MNPDNIYDEQLAAPDLRQAQGCSAAGSVYRKRTPRQLRPRTSGNIANEQTAEQLALRLWSATVAEKVLSDATKFKERFSRAHLERMVKRDLKTRSKIVRAKLI